MGFNIPIGAEFHLSERENVLQSKTTGHPFGRKFHLYFAPCIRRNCIFIKNLSVKSRARKLY